MGPDVPVNILTEILAKAAHSLESLTLYQQLCLHLLQCCTLHLTCARCNTILRLHMRHLPNCTRTGWMMSLAADTSQRIDIARTMVFNLRAYTHFKYDPDLR